MPCNCGKNRRRRTAATNRPKPKPKPKDDSKQPQQGGTQTFALETWDGKTYRFGSRLEAEAYNKRSGGGGTVRPA